MCMNNQKTEFWKQETIKQAKALAKRRKDKHYEKDDTSEAEQMTCR